MAETKDREKLRNIIRTHFKQRDFIGWFDALYDAADGKSGFIPWAGMSPNRGLISWLDEHEVAGNNHPALVIGCGLGDDAQALAERGFDVTAFDVSPAAIEWCKKRFPYTSVKYVQADLFSPPANWVNGFDFVFEAYTIQALPQQMREQAIRAVANLVGNAGTLLLICFERENNEPIETVPWPLSSQELNFFQQAGLTEIQFEDYHDVAGQAGFAPRRFRVEYKKEN